ncbi:uncharacterized protein LOC111436123 [Cucurbita moschata]|uniref:Uncharacterized protein LOC111436123 n=2 Tax=Cucurbita TaxID=3660 RepID=A0A6J1EUS2_CUCMO|nr:uncharacterized protein LOC111436123 [Cucurbita moschata]
MARRPFRILELSLLSAKDLSSVSKTMRTFAVAWIDPDRKLTTRVDQVGLTNPTWNEKFVFKVNDDLLEDLNATVTIEIYSSALLRDILVGTVTELVRNLIPQSSPSSNMRFLTLQVRRPSGRPKGTVNVGVTLLDSAKRSMPLESDLSSSAVDYDWDLTEIKAQKQSLMKNGYTIVMKRSQSDRYDPDAFVAKPAGSVCNASSVVGGRESVRSRSEVGTTKKIVNANGSLCSDVGPSPSVVAAAIAKGLYPAPDDVGSSILEDWTEKDSIEGLKTKIERWRTELHPTYDSDLKKLHSRNYRKKSAKKQRRKKGSGLFSCFGTAYGCEFSITCGGPNQKKKNGNGRGSLTPSEITFDESYV